MVAFLCSIKKRKFNYIVQDVFPDGLIRLSKISENGLIANVWKWFNQYTLKKSNKIIIIGRDMKKWVFSTSPKYINKTLYIPIWQDDNLIKPIGFKRNPFVITNNLQDKFVVQYSGNMGLWNDMRTFALAANKLVENKIHFTFIGDGIRRKEFLENLSKETSQSVQLFPFQPRKDLGSILTACHLALVSLNNGLEGIAVPSKIMGILAAGIPVIAMVPSNSEIALIIKENSCGVVLEPGDHIGLAANLLKLKGDKELRKCMGNNGRNAFLKKYSVKIVSEEYINLL